MIATPILLFELKGARLAVVRRLRRLPLVVYFAIKVLFYLVVIVGGSAARAPASFQRRGALTSRSIRSFARPLVFGVAMSVVGNLFFEIGRLLGLGTLKNLLTGRYVQPKREQKAFLLIDMKDSTGMAERLGPIRFHELLNEFFRDVADAALECDAEIHKYVGDEAILTWPGARQLRTAPASLCPFVARDLIAAQATTIAGASASCPSSAPPFIAARSSPAKSATCAARSPMSATR